MDKQELYVLVRNNEYLACVILNHDCNEGYRNIPWHFPCDEDKVLIPHALAVHPKVQKQGIGKIVVTDVIEMARARGMRALRLDILGINYMTEWLYTSMGFRFVTAKDMFYEDTGLTEYKMYELLL